MTNKIIYELPLNERIRTFLKLEELFEQMLYFSENDDEWHNRAELSCLLNILAIASRADLKTEIAKEIDRHIKSLAIFSKNPNVDRDKLGKTIEQLHRLNTEIISSSGRIDQKLTSVELLKCLSQRNNIPGGSCDFDIPAYHFWLNQPLDIRRKQIQSWTGNLVSLQQAIHLLLKFVRYSASPENITAQSGFYQQNLANQNIQLIRVSLEKNSAYFAEISGGKHRFTVRFMQAKETERAAQTNSDIHFTLHLCQI